MEETNLTEKGMLEKGEMHPAIDDALNYLKSLSYTDLMRWLDTFRTNAINGDHKRVAEVCYSTLERLTSKDEHMPIADVEIFALAWIIKDGETAQV